MNDATNQRALGLVEGDPTDAHNQTPASPSSAIRVHHYREPLNEAREANRSSFGVDGSLLSLLDPIPGASHARDRTISPPNSKCFAGTRKPVLKTIRSWVDSSTFLGNPHIIWVYGYAGCGKSAIAQNVAEYFAGRNRLAASFFFFRGSGDRNKVARFARTIASQVATRVPATAPIITNALSTNPGLLTGSGISVGAQFQQLVYDPINKVKWDRFAASLRHGPFLVVLDGLDECEDRVEIATFIEDMIEYFSRKPRTPLRFLITSRVENHIHERLHSSDQVRLLDLGSQTSDVDITVALDVAIAEGKHSWLSQDDKAKLITHIGGSFIFMTTILKSLFKPGIDDTVAPNARLPRVLAMSPDFDSLYRNILRQAQGLPHSFDVISVMALACQPLSIAQIADVLEIGTTGVVKVLANLHAIVQVPDDDRTPVTLWHTSLRDFLCSRDRAGSFFASHRALAFGCLSLSTSGNRLPRSPAFEYSQRFLTDHWTRFLEPMDGNTNLFNEEVQGIMSRLQLVFPSEITDFHLHVLDTILGCARKGTGSGTKVKTQGDGWSALEMATRADNWEGLQILLDAGEDLNHPFQDGATALEVVTHAERWEGLKILVSGGTEVLTRQFRDGTTALEVVTRAERWDGLQVLANAGPGVLTRPFQDGSTALEVVSYAEKWEGLKILLSIGPDIWNLPFKDGRFVFEVMTTNSYIQEQVHLGLGGANIDLNSPLDNGRSALEIACLSKEWKLVQVLVNANANVNIRFKGSEDGIAVALHAACHFNAKEMIHVLLQMGADPNVTSSTRLGNCRGWSIYAFPLAWAAAKVDANLVSQLLAHGANPNLKGSIHGSALHACTRNGGEKVVRLLLEHGGNPNIKDGVGRSPPHDGSLGENIEIARCLLEFGADPNIQDDWGNTPLHRAYYWGSPEVAQLLLNHNADPYIRNSKEETAFRLALGTE